MGDKFRPRKEFNDSLVSYKKSTNNKFWITDAKRIENQRNEFWNIQWTIIINHCSIITYD